MNKPNFWCFVARSDANAVAPRHRNERKTRFFLSRMEAMNSAWPHGSVSAWHCVPLVVLLSPLLVVMLTLSFTSFGQNIRSLYLNSNMNHSFAFGYIRKCDYVFLMCRKYQFDFLLHTFIAHASPHLPPTNNWSAREAFFALCETHCTRLVYSRRHFQCHHAECLLSLVIYSHQWRLIDSIIRKSSLTCAQCK